MPILSEEVYAPGGRSLEYQRKKAQRIASKERKMGQIWLSVAIVAAVLVVAALIVLLMSPGH